MDANQQPGPEWQKFLDRAYNELLGQPGLPFSEITPSKVTEEPGVYLITANEEKAETPYYVGQSVVCEGYFPSLLYPKYGLGCKG